MNFREAFKVMKEGRGVKLPSWGGYWWWDEESQTILMYTKDGDCIDIRESKRVEYTLTNILSDEWIVADGKNCPILGGMATFTFGDAIKYLKRGLKVARKGWNGKGMFLFLADNIDFDTPADLTCVKDLKGDLTCPSIVMKTADDKFVVGWLAFQTDMLAEDWVFVE